MTGLVVPAQAVADRDNDRDRGRRVIVSPQNMKGWAFAQETPTGSGMMVRGPSNPPLGKGSAELVVDSTGGEILGKAAYQGTFLRDFTQLSYWTYRQHGLPHLQIALQFNIDRDLTDADETFQGRLVYEPYYSHPTEVLAANTWLRWNTQDNAEPGSWWFTRPPQNAPGTGCSQADPCTWSEVLLKFPNAGVHRTFGAVCSRRAAAGPAGSSGTPTHWRSASTARRRSTTSSPRTAVTRTTTTRSPTGSKARDRGRLAGPSSC